MKKLSEINHCKRRQEEKRDEFVCNCSLGAIMSVIVFSIVAVGAHIL